MKQVVVSQLFLERGKKDVHVSHTCVLLIASGKPFIISIS